MPAAGSIVIKHGKDAVCGAVQSALGKNFALFNESGDATDGLAWFEWQENHQGISKDFYGYEVAVFDLNNDGKPDRVYSHDYTTNYMLGDKLLVQYGRSSRDLDVPENRLDKTSVVLPCQIDAPNVTLNNCPGFSENGDEHDFIMPSDGAAESVTFRDRYTNLRPFRFRDVSYIVASDGIVGKAGYVGVLKVRPDRSIEKTCLLQKLPFHM